MFVGLMRDVHATFAERWLKLQIEIGPPPQRGAPSGPLGAPPRKKISPVIATKPTAEGLVSNGPTGGPLLPPGVPPAPASNPYAGIGRNDPCPCGSGKKFKKCHGAGL